mgnify:CR=1 FL=1
MHCKLLIALILIIAESQVKDLLFIMNTIFVVSLARKDDFFHKSLQCIINDYNSLDKVRKNIKDVYNIEFEKLQRYAGWEGTKLNSITNGSDVVLTIERLAVVE